VNQMSEKSKHSFEILINEVIELERVFISGLSLYVRWGGVESLDDPKKIRKLEILFEDLPWMTRTRHSGDNNHLRMRAKVGLKAKQRLATVDEPVFKGLVSGLVDKSGMGHSKEDEGSNGPIEAEGSGRLRLVRLLLMHLEIAAYKQKKGADEALMLPSPLFLAIEALTIPNDPHTRAYPIAAVKAILSARLGVRPRNSFTLMQSESSKSNEASESSDLTSSQTIPLEIVDADLVHELGIWDTYIKHRDNRNPNSLKFRFIAHFLAALGVFRLRIPRDHAPLLFASDTHVSITDSKYVSSHQVEFRLSSGTYDGLPPASSLSNQVLGTQLALRGADVIFFNGLKASAHRGLVVLLEGGAGTGKTSFCLALASCLAPLGTKTLYFSFEEEAEDLTSKLQQQGQPRLRHLSFRPKSTLDFFVPIMAEPQDITKFCETSLAELIHLRQEMLSNSKTISPPIPILVVIDSISALTVPDDDNKSKGNRQKLHALVNECRKLNALVVLASGDDAGSLKDLDYLVDMVVGLSLDGAKDHNQKPARLFSVLKSRHQITRHGTHLFHLSGEGGFRFAPQLPSQMDSQQYRKRFLWDEHTFLEALNIRREANHNFRYKKFLQIHDRSQILIHGTGSGGKAGLAMKLALAPRYRKRSALTHSILKSDVESFAHVVDARVLVISFLYPRDYYQNLAKNIHRIASVEADCLNRLKSRKPSKEPFSREHPVEVLYLAPGVLNPEDLYSKMVRHLESARLEGEPFTTVIIDGLHNLALQFPGASDSALLLPIIYGTLSRSGVSSITTFTTLAVSSKVGELAGSELNQDAVFRLKGHLPLMHTLVHGSDFVLELSPYSGQKNRSEVEPSNSRDHAGAGYLVYVKSAISRDPPSDPIGWDRQDLVFTDPGWGLVKGQGELDFGVAANTIARTEVSLKDKKALVAKRKNELT
jgi:KaiC/GvpD/RAD55 family RecA-like ATPase